ncbi:MAG: ribulose-phosphate 3-epimerase, partial [Acholeplasmataceae bacterium]|nr:ribulose-phosphate 3-epimerase [Acholeplasmataceae bacterium]
LTADFTNLNQELKSIEIADYLHLDIMDGHFVPNISFGPFISSVIQKNTNLKLDTHLMVTDPFLWIEKFNLPNTKFITVHYEANLLDKSINKIHDLGLKAGISIKPQTEIKEILDYLNTIDLVLVMSVEPGFGGQKFMTNAIEKIQQLDQIRKDKNLNYLIEVDGGINEETAELCKRAGADILVVGSYLFNSNNRRKLIKKLQK